MMIQEHFFSYFCTASEVNPNSLVSSDMNTSQLWLVNVILGFHPRDFYLDDRVAIRLVGAQTNAFNREITVRK